MQQTSIADALFTRSQQRVLSIFFGKPDKSYYTNEIVRIANMGRGTITRELEKMASAGLISKTPVGNQIHYQANLNCPVYDELHAIVTKTFGITDVIKQALQPIDQRIELAFVYGSIAKGTDTKESDVDIMLVGEDLSYADVMELIMPAEVILQRPINPTLYTREEFQSRLKDEQSFLKRVKEQPTLMIKGDLNDVGKPV
jgi:predicted nucleotidyltransferase